MLLQCHQDYPAILQGELVDGLFRSYTEGMPSIPEHSGQLGGFRGRYQRWKMGRCAACCCTAEAATSNIRRPLRAGDFSGCPRFSSGQTDVSSVKTFPSISSVQRTALHCMHHTLPCMPEDKLSSHKRRPACSYVSMRR